GQVLAGARLGWAELPYDSRSFTTTSFYYFAPTTVYTDVAAGSKPSQPNQGIVRVIVLDPSPAANNSTVDYPTPTATGPVTIEGVTGSIVTLQSTNGSRYTFDVSTRIFATS